MLLPFYSVCPLFLFLALLHWLETPVMNSIGESKHPCLAINLRGKTVVFSTIKYNINYRLFKDTSYQVRKSLFKKSWVFIWRLLSGMDVWFCQMFFLCLLRWSYTLSFFCLVIRWIILLVFQTCSLSCIPRINST